MRSVWVRVGTRVIVVGLAGAFVLAGCSDSSDDAGPGTAVASTTTGAGDGSTALPRIDLIPEAVAALETQLGGPQEYFEINATAQLVNLFVALNDGSVVQPWVYFDGELSSKEGAEATGSTFLADVLTFDPETLLSQVQAQLPESALDAVEILGGLGGTVQYTVIVTSPSGGQLLVVVGPSGDVVSVDPI